MTRNRLSGWLASLGILLVLLGAMGCSSSHGGSADGETGEVATALTATLTSITLSAVPPGLPTDITYAIKATGLYSDGKARPLTTGVSWTSSNLPAASVDSSGVVTTMAWQFGGVTITARDVATNRSASVFIAITTAMLSSINLTPATKTVPVGTTQTYVATGIFSDASKYPLKGSVVTWSSGAPAIATVSAGVATTVAPGVAIISVRHTRTGLTDAATLIAGNVTLSSLAVSPATANIPNTTSEPFSALATYSDGSVLNVTGLSIWKSSKASVATVGGTGVASAVSNGFATITATYGALASTAQLTVGPIALTSIALTPPAPSIPLGVASALVATGTFVDRTTRNISEQVTWSTTNQTVVSVSNGAGDRGKLTTTGVGTARVRATDPTTGVTSSVIVTVTAAQLVTITVNPPQIVVPAGLTLACHASGQYTDGSVRDLTTAVTWTIVGAAGVTVSNAPGTEGVLTAATVGPPRYVKATDPSTMVSGQVAVTVSPALQTGLEITPPVATMFVGATQAFVATAVFSDGTRMPRPAVLWTSSNLPVLTVDNGPPPGGGVATANTVGAAVIRTSDNGLTASANVTVTTPTVTSMTITPAFPGPASTPKGASRLFRVIARLSDGTTYSTSDDVTWSTSDPAVGMIMNAPGSRGVLVGLAEGPVVITAVHPASGVVATLSWSVSSAVLVSAVLVPNDVSVPVGHSAMIKAFGHYSDGTDQDITQLGTWVTGDPAVAAVSTGGAGPQTVVGERVGITGITMQGPFNPSGSVQVTPAVLDFIGISGPSTLRVGNVTRLAADGTFSDGAHIVMTTQVLWSSSDATIASVSNAVGHEGELTAITTGTVFVSGRDPATGIVGALRLVVSAGGAPTVVAGANNTCALIAGGRVKCWGQNGGSLGLGDFADRGDGPGEMGALLPEVSLGTGRTAAAISLGDGHACALLDDGTVKCWGRNDQGQLGLGDTITRGALPGEMGDALPIVDLGAGRTAKSISAGVLSTCALLDDGHVKCWGYNATGGLGLGDVNNRGDGPGEMGDSLPVIDLGAGRTVKTIIAGGESNCAILDDDTLKCWGYNFNGQLGLGDIVTRGDGPGQMGDALPVVDLGAGRKVRAATGPAYHTCALLDDGHVKCWGLNDYGALGLGDTAGRGDGPGEMGDALPAIDFGVGRSATSISYGIHDSCALLDNGAVKCWGIGGLLGLGDNASRGAAPGEMGDLLPAIDLGTARIAKAIAGGNGHTCAVLDDDTVKCWGADGNGQLGAGIVGQTGSVPGEMGDALPVVDLTPCPFDVQTDGANCRLVGHSCLGGQCLAGVCQPVLVANVSNGPPWDINVFGGFATFNTFLGGVYRVSTDGGAVATVAEPDFSLAGFNPSGLAVDATSTVWTTSDSPAQARSVRSAPTSGGPTSTLLALPGAPFKATAMDDTDIYVAGDDVFRIPRDGSAPTVLVAGVTGAQHVAIDATSVYWTTTQAAGSVNKVSKAGGAPIVLAARQSYPTDVVVRDGQVYWHAGDGTIKRIGVNGGFSRVVASSPDQSNLYGFAVDETTVYFSDGTGGGALRSVSRFGGPARTQLIAGGVFRVALDAKAVYFTTGDAGARVMKIAK